jgi:ParB-like nuclease domain
VARENEVRSWLRGREPEGERGGHGDQTTPVDSEDSALGRWLAPTAASQIDQIPLSEVHAGWTPERAGETPLVATMALVRAVGVVDPVLLRPRGEGGYEVVTGHRTVAAARAVGCERIPAVVRDMDDAHALVALALDGMATGRVTERGAAELVERLHGAGIADEGAVAELLASLGIEQPPAMAGAATEGVPAADQEVAASPGEEEPVAATPVGETAASGPETEPEREAAATSTPEPAVTAAAPEPAVTAAPEPVPEPAATAASAPEPAAAAAPPAEAAPAAASPPAPALAGSAGRPAVLGPATGTGRWLPLPAGEPRLARLSSAFTDTPRLLLRLAADQYTGAVELSRGDGRTDVVVLLEGRCLATMVEQEGRPVDRPLRLPGPGRGPRVEIDVRPHAAPIVVALALALRSPAGLAGLHPSFLRLPALLQVLARDRADAACVVSTPGATGVILLSGGEPVVAYVRRLGERPGDVSETGDVAPVVRLLAGGEGEVDVHRGAPPVPHDLEALIAAAQDA